MQRPLSTTTIRAATSFGHRLPWNGLFWCTLVGLLGGALGMGWLGERDFRARLGTDGSSPRAKLQTGDTVKVALVLNGDELVVVHQNARARVRMLGIKAFDPVVSEREITAFGAAAVGFLEKWLLGQSAEVHFGTPVQDASGRYLAWISRDGIDINRRMVEEGVAAVYTEYPVAREATYLGAEILARRAQRGVWGGKKARSRLFALRKKWLASRALAKRGMFVDPWLEMDALKTLKQPSPQGKGVLP